MGVRMSCVDGSCIASFDLMLWLWSGAVLCPACRCGACDRWPWWYARTRSHSAYRAV